MCSVSRGLNHSERVLRAVAAALVVLTFLSAFAAAAEPDDTPTYIFLGVSDERGAQQYLAWSRGWLAGQPVTLASVPLSARPDIVFYASISKRRSPEVRRHHSGLRSLGEGRRYLISGGYANTLSDADGNLVTHCQVGFSRLLVLQEIAADFLRRKGWTSEQLLQKFSSTGSHVEVRDDRGVGLARPAGDYSDWSSIAARTPRSVALKDAIHKRRFLDALAACVAVHDLARSDQWQGLEPYRTYSVGGAPRLGAQNIDYSYFSPRGAAEDRRLREEELSALLDGGASDNLPHSSEGTDQ